MSLSLKSSSEIKQGAVQSILSTFTDCSTPLAIVFFVAGAILIIATIASGVESNKADNKNEEQRKSIRGFAAVSGIFGVVCLGLGIAMVVMKMLVK
jgi:hypothetical protein